MNLLKVAKNVRSGIDSNAWVGAAMYAVENFVSDEAYKKAFAKKTLTENDAKLYIAQLIQHLLVSGKYREAAAILWSPHKVLVEPRSVQLVWGNIERCVKTIAVGAGSMGKSYTGITWFLLDWLADPDWTSVRIVSSTAGHAKSNVWATIVDLIRSTCVPLPFEPSTEFIGRDIRNTRFGISKIAIPAGEDGKARLQGNHPVPRTAAHPKFGTHSRVRIIVDEAEGVPFGVWEGLDNILGNQDAQDSVKIFVAANPKFRARPLGKRCEPAGGWNNFHLDRSEVWDSNMGWRVVRLDGAKCENVVQKRIVYPGLLTWEGYQNYVAQGVTSNNYMTFARGAFPDTSDAMAVSKTVFDNAIGLFIFTGEVTPCAGVDLALEGDDKIIAATGRFGQVVGYTAMDGATVMFPKTKWGLQLDGLIALEKGDTVVVATRVMNLLKGLNVKPEWALMDRTGNGAGVHDYIKRTWSTQCGGLDYRSASTHTKVMQDNTQFADELYDGVVTELFMAANVLMEFHMVKISPYIDRMKLERDLTGREVEAQGKGKLSRVEPKKEFKKIHGESCDNGDAFNMLVHVVRMRSEFAGEMVEVSEKPEKAPQPGHVDTLQFMDFAED